LDGVNTYVLNKCALVLEGVTLAQVVELVVEVLVDLAGGTILDEKTAEDAESAHPNDLAVIVVLATRFILDIVEGCHFDMRLCVPWHTSVRGTLPLTETLMSAESLCGGHITGTGTGVHGDWLADDEAISNELADGLAGVGVGDLGDLIWVKPDLALSASNDGRRKALLGTKVDPVRAIC
jgi:hypothetical protein